MSTKIAGVAVLLMIFIHLFSYPHWLLPDSEWIPVFGNVGRMLVEVICAFGGICVSMFAFMSGYSLIVSSHSYSKFTIRLRRLMRFLAVYWLILGLFLLYGYACDDAMPTVVNLAYNAFGLNTGVDIPWVNVPFAWYVAFYIEFIFMIPILLWLFHYNNIKADIISFLFVVGAVYLIRNQQLNEMSVMLSSTVFPFISACLGILCAKYNVLEKCHISFSRRQNWYILLMILSVIIVIPWILDWINPMGGRNWAFLNTLVKAALTPLFIVVIAELLSIRKEGKVSYIIYIIGSCSMILWFIHGIFFTGSKSLQPYIYFPKEPLLIFSLCVIVLLPIAMVLRQIMPFAHNKKSKYAERISN